MIVAVADTHSAIWFLSADFRLSSAARNFMQAVEQQGNEIAVSAILLVEMVYLVEKSKIPPQRFSQLAAELDNPGGLFVEIPVTLNIARTLSGINVLQIPDMPDRIIAATALALNVPIISRNARIQQSALKTIW